ncbi:Dna-directed rna polymerase subunit beta like [Thalictrum thalictroides]|uniref:Dna-directed rna polymerase subunit beta like n=1 Tax=Thalictrum thalictroides TaxID=46969 RepID=A0A7J6X9I1_THATH|nr:Dna-directed rna polymerase subunit beta like [Thalictrum thalictroides]
MGNCFRHESSTTWGGEEWGSPLPQKLSTTNGRLYNKAKRDSPAEGEFLLGDEDHDDGDEEKNVSSSPTEVKIKITKKELEELLGKVDVQGLSVQQLLAQLINASNDYHIHNSRSWRPALSSIPEVNFIDEDADQSTHHHKNMLSSPVSHHHHKLHVN